MVYDALIIGAGLSGLAAGIRLAHFGKKVCIAEQHVEIGGLNSFYRRGARWFDVGLHAMTNYAPKGARHTPLGKLLKQLRINHDDFQLCEQLGSEIRFPGASLRFTNDFAFFTAEIGRVFPAQSGGFHRLTAHILGFNELSLASGYLSARAVLAQYLTEPLLIDMLLCPLMFYGNPQADDMDFTQFVIMFKSIYMEGFARPAGGMRAILKLLLDKYLASGGELLLRRQACALQVDDGAVTAAVFADGSTLEAHTVISSAGYKETMRLCQPPPLAAEDIAEGKISFVESQYVLNKQPAELGHDKTIVFFSAQPEFRYRVPDAPVDMASGVICCSNNFRLPQPAAEGLIRLTFLANPALWNHPSKAAYKEAKKEWQEKTLQSVLTFLPDFRDNIVFSDTFTPRTIARFTGHINGAVYGAPEKLRDGKTPLKNLFVCGTDQGFLGIVGATLSGITVANLYGLKT